MPNSRKQKIAMLKAYVETGEKTAVYRLDAEQGFLTEEVAKIFNDENARKQFCINIVDSVEARHEELLPLQI